MIVIFNVFSAKKPTFDPTSGPFYLFKNSQGVLKCEPEAAPPPTFEWYRKGSKITTGGRYTVQKDGVLLINDVTDDDAGDYRCVAENFLDKAEYNGVATVYGKKNSILHSAVGPCFRGNCARFHLRAGEWYAFGGWITYKCSQSILNSNEGCKKPFYTRIGRKKGFFLF